MRDHSAGHDHHSQDPDFQCQRFHVSSPLARVFGFEVPGNWECTPHDSFWKAPTVSHHDEGFPLLTLDFKNIFSADAETQDPRDRDLLPSTANSKELLWVSYFRKLTKDVTLAVDWTTGISKPGPLLRPASPWGHAARPA